MSIIRQAGFMTVLHRRTHDIVLTLIGLAFGTWFVGPKNLNPAELEWLAGDARLNQLAFESFWRSPILQFPVTAIRNTGFGWNFGLHQNGESGLLAVAVRPLATHFQDGFQFQGVWVVICLAAQLVIARRIFQELGASLISQLVGSVMVALNPALISRIGSMWHMNLASHWMILLAILMYLRQTSTGRWALFVAVTIPTSIYISAIVLIVAIVSITESSYHAQEPHLSKARRFASGLLLIGSVCIATLLVFGYGPYLTGQSEVRGTGFFRASLFTFVNPVEPYGNLPELIPAIRQRIVNDTVTDENTLYLGMGAILSVGVLTVVTVWRKVSLRRQMFPVLVVAIALFLVALSSRITFLGREFNLEALSIADSPRRVFRSAPRFAWLLMYLLLFLGVLATDRVARQFRRVSLGRALICGVFILQILDIGPGILATRDDVTKSKGPYLTMIGDEWRSIAKENSRLYLVPSVNPNNNDLPWSWHERRWFADKNPDLMFELAWLAALEGNVTNFAYCARPCYTEARRSTEHIRKEIDSRKVQPGTVLVFSNESEWLTSAARLALDPRLVDGVMVLVTPSLKLQ